MAVQVICPHGVVLRRVGGLGSKKEPTAQQVELGAALHASLQQLEAVDLPLGLPAAPVKAKFRSDGGSVLVEAGGEARDDAHSAMTSRRQPHVERRDGIGVCPHAVTAAAHDPAEATTGINDLGGLVILQDACDLRRVPGIEIARLAQKMPRQLLR